MSEFLLAEMAKQGFPDVSKDPRALKRLMIAIEKAKRELSSTASVDLMVEAIVPRDGDTPARDFTFTLTKTDFDRICRGLFQRCIDTVKHVLKDASITPGEVDDVVLVGGSTRIPKIQSMLSEFFNGKELCKTLNPDEVSEC